MIEGLQELTGEVVTTQTLDGNVDGEFISSGEVDDVLVNGTSVVENKVANVAVPTDLKDLNDDSTHRVVTDSEKTTWSNKSDFSGNYEDLTNKPDLSIYVDNTELEESQSIQDEKIDLNSMVYNALPKITGNNDVIIGTSNTPIKLELEGNCYQEETPTPDNPQVVHVVTGNNTINVLTKNMFDKNSLNGGWVRALDGTVLEQYTDTYNYTPFIKVDSNTTYTIDLYNYSGLGSAGVCEYSSNTQSSFIIAVNETQRYITFTTDVNTKYIRFTVRVDSKDFVMLEKGSTTTEYASYQSQTYPITLGNLEYCKIENNKDEFIKATNEIGLISGKWYLKKNIGKVILDGSDSGAQTISSYDEVIAYTLGGSYQASFSQIITKASTTDQVAISNYFNKAILSDRNTKTNIIYSYNDGMLRIANNISSTKAGFLTWLATHKPTVYYLLTTPEYILLDDTLQTELNNIQAAVSYNGQTNLIQINDDLPFTINYNANKNVLTKTSELTNDSGFITNAVNNLTNYYLKSETYTKSEVNTLISNIEKLTIEIVQTLPQTGESNVLYLVPKEGTTNDVYDEYLYINNNWEHIGSTEVDLSNYYTKDETKALLEPVYVTAFNNNNFDAVTNKNTFEKIINQAYKNQNSLVTILGINTGSATSKVISQFSGYLDGVTQKTTYLYKANQIFNSITLGSYRYDVEYTITGSWTNNVFTLSTISRTNQGTQKKFLTADNTSSYTPENNYNPAHKLYVDTAVANKQDMIVYRAVLSAKEYTGASLNYLGNADKEIFRSILQDAYDKQLNNFAILVSIVYGNGTGANTSYKSFLLTTIDTKKIINKPTSINFAGFCQDLISLADLVFNKLGLAVTLSWSGDTLSISKIILKNLKQRYLDTNNTDYTYNPVNPYNPATKKYVDDKIGDINTILASLTTPSNGGN
jgi:hypothetical protein